MKKSAILLAFLSIITLVSASANATPIEFIFTGTGTGAIDGSGFSDAAFTITEYSNTNDIQSCGNNCAFIDATSTVISIDGVGSFDFITGTRTFNNSGRVGFSRGSNYGSSDLYDIFEVGPDYDLASAIGPVSGFADLLQWGTSVETSGGVLFFANQNTAGTFEARIASIPEPGTIILLGFGLAGLGFSRRRKS